MDDNTCSICYDKSVDISLITCGHKFCHKCIGKWMDKNNTCPICRKATDPEESFLINMPINAEQEKSEVECSAECKAVFACLCICFTVFIGIMWSVND